MTHWAGEAALGQELVALGKSNRTQPAAGFDGQYERIIEIACICRHYGFTPLIQKNNQT
jgi:Rieske Fe-S protein